MNKATLTNRLEFAAKLLLFAYLALSTCCLTYGTRVITVAMLGAFGLGAAALLLRVLHFGQYRKMPGLWFGVFLLASYLLSAAVNYKYQTKTSLVFPILWCLSFFLLYTQRQGRPEEEVRREFRFFAALFLLWTTVLVIGGLGMALHGYEFSYYDVNNANYEVGGGFFAGRLWGMFQDPNLGSVMACNAIALCVYGIRHICSKLWQKVLLLVDVFLMLWYMALSDSRTGMVCLGVTCAAGVFFLFRRTIKKKTALQTALAIVAAAAALAAGFFAPKVVQRGYNAAVVRLNPDWDKGGREGWFNPRPVDRGYSMEGDISNRRLTLWESGLEIGLSRPVTGVSFVGAKEYARRHLPNTFIVADPTWIYNTFDSEPVNVFVGQGFLGLGILAAWAIFALIRLLRHLREGNDREGPVALWIVLFLACAASALFQGTILYQNTPNTFLFWLVFGYLCYNK